MTVADVAELTEDVLQKVDIFKGTQADILRPLLTDAPIKEIAKDEVLLAGGRSNRRLYLLLSGRLSVRLSSEDSSPITFIEEGQTAGELSLIDHQPASAFVVAECDSVVLCLDEDTVWELVNMSHAVASNLLHTLVKRMRYGNNIIVEDREKLAEYQFHATVDALTGMYNRRWLNSMLPRLMHRAHMSKQPLSLLMVDIDQFKQFNDSHGHVDGDCALRGTATTITNTIRPGDMASRYGGEEFLIILPDCSLDSALTAAERLREAVSGTVFTNPDGELLPPVTISVGVAEMCDDPTMEELIKSADAVLYRAKKSGRNCVCA
ncbi:MAG: GGDEF domain-containing protein [Gammaproteobacteria bacterium]|nr:GGDEF domain-containing protein [Gammaproteobacteria bacterium]MDX2461798.1 GGDEF domain-containing protein [Gammaproteobacteria bacterium]